MNSSTIRLYADDCLKYKEIHAQHDTEDLKTDLDALGASVADEFSSTEMSTTTNHTEVISNHRPVQHPQCLRCLAQQSNLEYLHQHCAWSKHINQTAKKANNTLAFLQRNLCRAPTSVKKRAHRLSLGPFWNTLALSGIHTLKQTFTRWKWCYARMRNTPAVCNDFGHTNLASLLCSRRSVGGLSGLEIHGSNGSKCYGVFSFATGMLMW